MGEFNLKNLIFNAFAFKEDYESSANLSKTDNIISIYLKNICVSLFTAKEHNPKDDVALITNIDIPEPYKSFLNNRDIYIYICNYDTFTFPSDFKWSLAFYKLCALEHALSLEYDKVLMMDTDTITIQNYQYIWEECSQHILLYDVNRLFDNKLYQNMLEDYKSLTGKLLYFTHYGGEFIATNKENGTILLNELEGFYHELVKENVRFDTGDEFILSVAAYRCRDKIKNAGAYIERHWTGRFYSSSTHWFYDKRCILHLPGEKTYGFLKLYHYIDKKKKIPSMRYIEKEMNLSRAKPLHLYHHVLKKKILTKLKLYL